MSETHADAGTTAHPETKTHAHPGPGQYIVVALILAAITAVEVVRYYVKLSHPTLISSLLVLSAVKFAMVVMWFMHLKFDHPIFRRFFILGFFLAMFVYAIVLTLFFTR